MIRVKNLKKTINKVVVISSISFHVDDNDFFVIGCQNNGKTTICKLLSKLIEPDEGIIEYSEELSEKDVLLINDDPEIENKLTNYEYLEFYCKCANLKEKNIKNKIDFYFRKYDLDNLKYANYDDIDISNKKIINLISALLSEKRVIIIDELYKNISPRDENIVNKILNDLIIGHTIIVTCTNIDEYIEYANKILILENGKIKIYDEKNMAINKLGYKNYLEILYTGDQDYVSTLLHDIKYIKEFTINSEKIDIVTFDYENDNEILKVLLNNGIKISALLRKDKK